MAVVFTVLMVMAGIYALFKWPIPTLAVLGVLIVIGKSGENKNGGTAPTTAPPPAKPKAPSSPIKPQAVQPTVQAQPKAPEVRKAYTAPSMKELLLNSARRRSTSGRSSAIGRATLCTAARESERQPAPC